MCKQKNRPRNAKKVCMFALGNWRGREQTGEEADIIFVKSLIYILKVGNFCISKDLTCTSLVGKVTGCSAECSGLYARLEHREQDFFSQSSSEWDSFQRLAREYKMYKDNFATLRRFDPLNESYGKGLLFNIAKGTTGPRKSAFAFAFIANSNQNGTHEVHYTTQYIHKTQLIGLNTKGSQHLGIVWIASKH